MSDDNERAIFDEMGETAYGPDTWRAMKDLGAAEASGKRVSKFVSNVLVIGFGMLILSIMGAAAYSIWSWVLD